MQRIILLILCLALISLAAFDSSLRSDSTQMQKNKDEIIGAYNHLTLCFALVRNILQVESIRRDILSNVNLASLPTEAQELYKSLLHICDKASTQRQTITELEGSVEEMKRKAETEQTTRMLSSLISTSSGNPQALLSLIFSGKSGESQQMESARSKIQELKALIAQEVSDFEFQLGLQRSKLAQVSNVEQKRFITTADVDQYLELQFDESAPEKYYSSLTLLHQRSPTMYFVAYELGKFAFRGGQLASAQQYFVSAVENTPTILKYNPIRVDAHCFLGDILVRQAEHPEAINEYSKALEEDGGSIHALRGKAMALHLAGRYTEAKALYENGLRIQPSDPNMRYNYACALALLGTDRNIVLDHLKRAFNSGFTEITYAKSDTDFASVRDSELFKELTQIRFGYDVDWNALIPDKLIISNQSEFDWTNIIIKVNFLENHSQGWKTMIGDDGIRKERLKRGDSFSFEAFNSTKISLISIRLNLHAEQGSINAVFQNLSGQLQMSKMETQ